MMNNSHFDPILRKVYKAGSAGDMATYLKVNMPNMDTYFNHTPIS